ncbi:hypothetical protein ABL78_6211 [Leptomonas seymouri]|uniref:PH-like domain-containing protein n=1 Tax=Leptomonas seymouri TaxID=5684 RepID=A0A0N1I2F0_LEPSE|nr:hypothetical protein ABL78_6211 [Leptomonas seymouri]|eukprot:KPI84744.1 hypothetical protein ABL78_6211 [Leptomonas seymouri]
MSQPEPSVSDSISYLQNFLNTPHSVCDERATRPALPPQPLLPLPRPPSSLPASFISSSFHSQPSSPPRRSPPSAISALSQHISTSRSFIDDRAPSPAHTVATPIFPPRTLFQREGNTSLCASSVLQPPLASKASPLLGSRRKPIRQTSSGALRYSDGASNLSDSFASKDSAPVSVVGASGMLRYGTDVAHRTSESWRNVPTAPRRSFTPLHNDGQHASPLWGPSPSSQWQQRPSTSASSAYGRTSLRAEGRFPWRQSSVSLPTHQGSSLLWGWGSEGGRDAGTAPFSLPLHQPSPYSSGDRLQGDQRNGDTKKDVALRASASLLPSGPAARRPREVAYEEVGERDTQATSPKRELLRRRPPLLPPTSASEASSSPRAVEQVGLTTCHTPEEHTANIHRIAHYLKDYYAREADEKSRGVESLTAEDVAGLAQCFYIDLYRTVRHARRSAGLEVSSFAAEDPTENVIASVEPPPPPPQREEGRNTRSRRANSTSPPGRNTTPPPPESEGSDSAGTVAAGGEGGEGDEGRFTSSTPSPRSANTRSTPQGSTPANATHAQGEAAGPSNSVNTSTASVGWPHQQRQQFTPHSHSALHPRNPLLSSPEDELLTSAAATTGLASNQQLAYSGGGTHTVQVVTALVPAFRNGDKRPNDQVPAQSAQQHQRHRTAPERSSPSSGQSGVQSVHHRSPSFGHHHDGGHSGVAQGENATDAVSLCALASMPSPPYRRMSSLPQQPLSSGQPQNLQHPPWATSASASPYTRTRQPANASRSSGPSSGITKDSVNSSCRSQRPAFSSVQHERVRSHQDGSSSSNSSGWSDGDGDEVGSGALLHTAEGSEDESPAGPRAPSRRSAPTEPPSGIVKRPLKELMPLLRSQAALIVKHTRHGRRPHLRLFQILDCMDAYKGREVLMPHFTWASAKDAYRHGRRPRQRRAKKGVPLPTGLSLSQQEVPYMTALNLTRLEAVYVGAGRGISAEHMSLFHRRKKDGAIVDHLHHPVANGMCAVFVFASRAVAVTFLREDDRQMWVGAMMGVVERNRTLSI